MKRLPIGISDFKKLIEEDYYYVDKTLLIKEIITIGGEVSLITRPRRFGKTLNLSMLRYFFEYTEIKHDYLFYHTLIWREPSYRDLQGQSPVIFITFKDCKESSQEICLGKITLAIAQEFDRHKYLLLNGQLEQFEIEKFNRIRMGGGSLIDLSDSLLFLSKLLYNHYSKRVIILIDEYDVPIHAAFIHGYYASMLDFMRSLLTTVLKDNPLLERSVVTGILPIAKAGIFTGLNNLSVFTITNRHLADKFGFTEPEVKELWHYYTLEPTYDAIRTWYNGYTFGIITPLYNPWSIIKCAQNAGSLELYWVNTQPSPNGYGGQASDNMLLKRLISRANKTIKAELEQLLTQHTIAKIVDESITFSEIEHHQDSLWTLLLFTGYLTYESYTLREGKKECILKIPNEEVKHLYKHLIRSLFEDALVSGHTEELLRALTEGDVEPFKELLQGFILNSMSMYDLPASEPEKSYHLFVLGLLVTLNKHYEVKSSRESGYGRYDIMIIPYDHTKLGIVIEFKKISLDSLETLDEGTKRALEQIKDKKYAQELHARGIKQVLALGIACQGKKIAVSAEYL